MERRWWPLFHKTIDAGKKVFINGSYAQIMDLKREFGPKLKEFLIRVSAADLEEAEEIVHFVSE